MSDVFCWSRKRTGDLTKSCYISSVIVANFFSVVAVSLILRSWWNREDRCKFSILFSAVWVRLRSRSICQVWYMTSRHGEMEDAGRARSCVRTFYNVGVAREREPRHWQVHQLWTAAAAAQDAETETAVAQWPDVDGVTEGQRYDQPANNACSPTCLFLCRRVTWRGDELTLVFTAWRCRKTRHG